MGSPVGLKLPLDTHAWIWALLNPERLAPDAAEALGEPDNELWLSPISVWEALLLIEAGRVAPGPEPASWLAHAAIALPVRDAPLTREVAIASRALDLPQQDPADRFIGATAQVHSLTLVTADRQLLARPRLEVLRAA